MYISTKDTQCGFLYYNLGLMTCTKRKSNLRNPPSNNQIKHANGVYLSAKCSTQHTLMNMRLQATPYPLDMCCITHDGQRLYFLTRSSHT